MTVLKSIRYSMQKHILLYALSILCIGLVVAMNVRGLPTIGINLDSGQAVTVVVFEGEIKCPGTLQKIGPTQGSVFYMKLEVACEER